MMGVAWQNTYLRRVCVRSVMPCVNSVWVPGPGTVPHAEMQGENIFHAMWPAHMSGTVNSSY